jgi:hypothetical protein
MSQRLEWDLGDVDLLSRLGLGVHVVVLCRRRDRAEHEPLKLARMRLEHRRQILGNRLEHEPSIGGVGVEHVGRGG